MTLHECALPSPAGNPGRNEIPGFCTLCRSRCGSINVVENGRLVEVRPNPAHPTGGALCPKGRAAPEIVHSSERLLYPLRRTRPKEARDPGWQRVSWDEALDDIARRLKEIAASDGPEAVAFAMTSASASSISDSRPWLERFIWSFGSPNLCTSGELCNWHKDFTHALTFGRGISTPDYANTSLAVLWGHNPSHVWLAEVDAVTAARRRGAGLVVIDPRRTALAAEADLWLRIRPGSDAVLAMAVARILTESGGYDQAFVRRWTNAPLLVRQDNGLFLRAAELGVGPATSFVVFDEIAQQPRAYDPALAVSSRDAASLALEGEIQLHSARGSIRAEPAFGIYRRALAAVSLERAAEETGIPAPDITSFAEMLGAAASACYYGWTGIGQHANATQIDRAIATLFALKGQVDAPGGNVAWPAPKTNPIDDPGLLSPEQRQKTLGLAERPLGPAARGWITAGDLYRAILERKPYGIRALVAFGSNPLVSRAEPERGRQALERLDLQVHCDLFPNPTANTADYLLPVNTAWEREGLRVGFEIGQDAQSLIQLRPAMVASQGESRSDFWIAAELAKRLGFGGTLFDGDLTRAHDHVLAPAGVSVAQLRAAPEGLTLPVENPIRGYARERAGKVQGFLTPTGRVEFYSEALRRLGQPPVPDAGPKRPRNPEFPLILTQGKFGHFCHSQHRQIAALRRRSAGPQLSLSLEAAEARGIADGDPVEIRTPHGRIQAAARLDDKLHGDVVVGEFGWWQACDDLGDPAYPITGPASANYNLLASTRITDPVSNAPEIRSLPCEVSRAADAPERWAGFMPLEVCEVRRETDAVTVIEVARPDGERLPPYRPGQFISVGINDLQETRSYSLIGPALEISERYRIAVKGEPMGAVSRKMRALKMGETLLATMPAGRFTLPLHHARPLVLIAFGIGITPFMSMLETLAANRGDLEIVLYHAVPCPAAQPFHRRLLALQKALPRLHLISCFSRAAPGTCPPGADGRGTRFSVAVIPGELIERRARFYICGAPEAILQTKRDLLARAVFPFEIFEERFRSPRPAAVTAADVPRRITLARSGREIVWTPAEGSILDAVTKQGIAMASGCRVGQCESCAVRLLEGSVAYAEPPSDLEGDLCLTCSATPASDILLDA